MRESIGLILVLPPSILREAEGLARHLALLLKGFQEKKIKAIILHPLWLRNDLIELCNAQKIQIEKDIIEFLSPSTFPPIYILENYLSKIITSLHKFERGNFLKVLIILETRIEKKLPKILIRSNLSKILIIFFFVLLAVLTYGCLNIFYLCFQYFIKITKYILLNLSKKEKIKEIIDNFSKKLQYYYFTLAIELLNDQSKKVASLTNNIEYSGGWIIMNPFWPEVPKMVQNSAIILPDIVFHETPVGYICNYNDLPDFHLRRRANIGEALHNCREVIVYSEYVKEKHLISFLGQDKITHVVPHAPIDMSEYLKIFTPFCDLTKYAKKDLCLQIAHDYLKTLSDEWLFDFDLDGVKFLMYTSQLREHKNFMNLFKAYNIILREKYYPIKMIITAKDILKTKNFVNFITKNGLCRDIIILPNLPNKVMAAFCHLATLAVNSTLFEGGFPFTFSEAMSVGTPSLLSKIPVVEEVITDPNMQSYMLFDPYNLDEIVEKICWGIDNRDTLYQIEKPLYDEMKKRTWGDVATDYYNIAQRL